jgi:hypothetical protein
LIIAAGRAMAVRDAAAPARPQAEHAAVQTWARWAAYAAVAGFGLRLLAQALVGMNQSPLVQGPAMLIFEAGFVLAGVLLPLALVYSWGQIWPRWVPLLAGRRVPRSLLIVPAAAVGGGLTVYFGVGTGQLAVETVTATSDASGAGDLPLWFFWLAMPAYLLWGVALAAAALAYQRRTRRRCKECAR